MLYLAWSQDTNLVLIVPILLELHLVSLANVAVAIRGQTTIATDEVLVGPMEIIAIAVAIAVAAHLVTTTIGEI